MRNSMDLLLNLIPNLYPARELEPDEKGPSIEDGVAYLSFFLEIDDNNMLTVELPGDDGEYVKVKKTPEEMQEAIKEKLEELKSFSDIGDGTISVDVTEDILPQLALDATANDTLRLSRIRPLNAKDVEAIYRLAIDFPQKGC